MKRAAFAELYAIGETRLPGELAGHAQECPTQVEADCPAAGTDASGDFTSDDTATAANVEDALTRGNAEQVEIGLARVDFVLRFSAELEPIRELARLRSVPAGSVAPEALSSVLAQSRLSVGPHQAVHDCIRRSRWQQQATAQHTLTDSTDFLRHSLAARVSRRAHNLESNQIGLPKRVLGDKANGCRCHPSPHRGRSNPVAQIRKSVHRTDLIDPATAKEATGFTEDRKLVGHALFGKLLLDGHPLSSLVERVMPVAPRHPGVYLGHRLQGGHVHCVRVPLLIQTDSVSTHVVTCVLRLSALLALPMRRGVATDRKLGGPACMLEHDPITIWVLERLALLVPVRVERLDRLVAQLL